MLFEDNTDLRNAISMLIKGSPGFDLVGAFPDVITAEKLVETHQPDVILMDINLPDRTGIDALRGIREKNSAVHIIMLTVFEDETNLVNAICHGANGYLLKHTNPAKLLEAIEEVLKGGAPMTPIIANKVLRLFAMPFTKSNKVGLTTREKEILKLLVEGNSYKMISSILNISIETVKTHIKNIYEKLQVHSQTEAVAKAINENLV